MRTKKLLMIVIPLLIVGTTTALVTKSTNSETIKQNNNENKKNSAVIHLTSESFKNQIFHYEKHDSWNYKGDKPAIIEFYANWCAPCRQIAPVLDTLSIKYKDKIDVYKINVEKEKTLAQLFRVRGIPTFLFVPLNTKPYMKTGYIEKKQLIEQISKLTN